MAQTRVPLPLSFDFSESSSIANLHSNNWAISPRTSMGHHHNTHGGDHARSHHGQADIHNAAVEDSSPKSGVFAADRTSASDSSQSVRAPTTAAARSASPQREHQPLRCFQCDEYFARPFTLKRHQQTRHRHGIRFNCPHVNCQYHTQGFSRKDNLAKHLRRKH